MVLEYFSISRMIHGDDIHLRKYRFIGGIFSAEKFARFSLDRGYEIEYDKATHR